MITQRTSHRSQSLIDAFNRPMLALLALQLMGGMLLSPHFAFFSVYLQERNFSTLLIANITTVKQIAGLIASLFGGTLSDSLGRKRTLLLGNLGYLLASFVFLLRSPFWIGLLWTIGGLGLGLHTLGAQSYLLDVAVPDYLGLLSALFNWGYTLGGALSSPIVGLILERGSYTLLGQTMIVFALLTLIVNSLVLPRSPVECQAHVPTVRYLGGYGDIAARPAVLILALLRFLPTLAYATMLLLVPLMLNDAGASKTIIAWYATVSWTVASLAQIIAGRAADLWGARPATAVTFSTLIVSLFGLGLWPTHLWPVFVLGTTGLAAAWSLSTLLPNLVAQVTAAQERGRVLGFIHLWWNLAMILGSLGAGALAELSIGIPFGVAGALNLLSLFLLVRL